MALYIHFSCNNKNAHFMHAKFIRFTNLKRDSFQPRSRAKFNFWHVKVKGNVPNHHFCSSLILLTSTNPFEIGVKSAGTAQICRICPGKDPVNFTHLQGTSRPSVLMLEAAYFPITLYCYQNWRNNLPTIFLQSLWKRSTLFLPGESFVFVYVVWGILQEPPISFWYWRKF